MDTFTLWYRKHEDLWEAIEHIVTVVHYSSYRGKSKTVRLIFALCVWGGGIESVHSHSLLNIVMYQLWLLNVISGHFPIIAASISW